jgi:Biopterin-dependent aromatic amino acid hydroxylase
MLDNRVVPWFPKDVAELDLVANKTLEAGVDIESDHPGFLDQGKAIPRSPSPIQSYPVLLVTCCGVLI